MQVLGHREPPVSTASFNLRMSASKIWVDAICINQEDNAEKSQQVQQMAQIYSKAIGALVWLGDAYEDGELAFDTLERLGSMSAVLRTLETQPFDQPLIRLSSTSSPAMIVQRVLKSSSIVKLVHYLALETRSELVV
jgi:hypothetical protein